MPLSALTKTEDAAETLRNTKRIIDIIEDRNLKSNLASATYIISGLVLNKDIVDRILRSDMMRESVTYQEILLEGKAEGLVEGEAKGEAKGEARGELKAANQIALNMFSSGLELELIAKFTGLSPEQLRKLQSESQEA